MMVDATVSTRYRINNGMDLIPNLPMTSCSRSTRPTGKDCYWHCCVSCELLIPPSSQNYGLNVIELWRLRTVPAIFGDVLIEPFLKRFCWCKSSSYDFRGYVESCERISSSRKSTLTFTSSVEVLHKSMDSTNFMPRSWTFFYFARLQNNNYFK